MASSSCDAWAAFLFAAAMLVRPADTRAQTPHVPTASYERSVQGTIERASATGARPLAGNWVTLHRVGADHAGPIDSMRTNTAGRFAFRYALTGDTGALYFVSSRHAGIAYFTPPLRMAVVAHGEADLVLYDTTSAPVPIHVRGRHIVVMAPDSTRKRPMVEAYEVSNDSTITRVAGSGERPTFEALLPDGARDLHASDGDVSAEAVMFDGGRVRVFAPLAPGRKQLSFTYHLAVSGTPMSVPSTGAVSVLEVLLEDAKGSVSGAGLTETAPAILSGRRFRRFLAHDVPAASVISITAPTIAPANNVRIAVIVTVIGATMVLALARSLIRRGPSAVRGRGAAADEPDALEREIAALDASFANLDSPRADQRADHYEARAHLKARRLAALGRRG